MTDREAMKLALEKICGAKLCEINSMSSRKEMLRLMDEAITALRERLAQPVQEPVKFKCTVIDDANPNGVPLSQWECQSEQEPFCYHDGRNIVGKEFADHSDVFPLYTAPPPRQWHGLTETERINLEILIIGQIQVTGLNVKGISNAIRAVEQVLKEKNK